MGFGKWMVAINLLFLCTVTDVKVEEPRMGRPINLIENGKILMNGLRRARLTKNNLSKELRVKGLLETNNIEQAFLEPGGKLSILKNIRQHEVRLLIQRITTIIASLE